jgi:hypothetical protein
MASTAVMSSGTAVDLALLGLVAEQPRPADELVGAECRREAAATLLDAGRRRASTLEMAQWTGCCGPVVERCLALEQAREALELGWLQDVVAATAIWGGDR